MKITTVYDNRTLDPNLASAWGFCLVGDDLLFDTGGENRRLLSNSGALAISVPTATTLAMYGFWERRSWGRVEMK